MEIEFNIYWNIEKSKVVLGISGIGKYCFISVVGIGVAIWNKVNK